MNFTIREPAGGLDMICEGNLLYHSDFYARGASDHAVIYDFQGKCLVIPRVRVNLQTISVWGIVGVLLVGAAIVVIFWLASRFLKVDERLRHPINTVSVILGVSITAQPKRVVEKILFIFLVMASTRYTAMFYTELYNLGVVEESDLDIKSFEELDKAGIPVAINTNYFDLISDDLPDTLKCRAQPMSHGEIISIEEVLKRNLSTFVIKPIAEMYTARLGSDNKPLMKLTDFRIFTTFHTYPSLPLHNTYKDRMNDILLRTLESGLRQKWSERRVSKDASISYRKYIGQEGFLPKPPENTSCPETRIIFYLLYLYPIPWTVFFMEVIYGWWLKRKRMICNKRRSRFRMNQLFGRKLRSRRMITLNV